MSVVVTGGAGFLGRHLVQFLLDRGRRVIVLDSLWTGSTDNIRCFENNPLFRYLICDVRSPLPEVEDDDVSEIYHLACPASPDHFETNPIEILDTCFNGTKNVLDFALRHKARVLIASTSETYGDPLVSPQPESYRGNVNCFGPRSCYDEGKRAAESLAYAYRARHRRDGLEVRVARIFNAYGPHMAARDGRAVPNFVTAALDGRPLVVYGPGDATRCFQFATDCVRGLAALMACPRAVGPVNIGSDVELPVAAVARIISDLVAAKLGRPEPAPVHFLPGRQDDPLQRKPDISLARDLLGWSPEVPLEQGIDATINYFWKAKMSTDPSGLRLKDAGTEADSDSIRQITVA